MANNNNTIYQTPPIGSRPPFATDDDHMYDEKKSEQARRLRQPSPENPNDRSSAYNMYVRRLSPSRRLADNRVQTGTTHIWMSPSATLA